MNAERTDDESLVAYAIAGCNAEEVAAYCGVDKGTAVALLIRARQLLARLPDALAA